MIKIQIKLRNVVKACLNLKPESRPNITQIYQIATQMHQHYQSLGNITGK